jgi:hypothetical protein
MSRFPSFRRRVAKVGKDAPSRHSWRSEHRAFQTVADDFSESTIQRRFSDKLAPQLDRSAQQTIEKLRESIQFRTIPNY